MSQAFGCPESSLLSLVAMGKLAWADVSSHLSHPLYFSDYNRQLIHMALDSIDARGEEPDPAMLAGELSQMPAMEAQQRIAQYRQLMLSGHLDGMTREQLACMRVDLRNDSGDTQTALDVVGGYAGLSDVIGHTAHKSRAKYYISQVRRSYRARTLRDVMSHAIEMLDRPDGARRYEEASSMVSRVASAGDVGEEDDVVDAGVILRQLVDREDSERPLPVVYGVPGLDGTGLNTEQFTVLSGYPGCGKTALALQGLRRTADLVGLPGACMMVSLEMPLSELVSRIARDMTGISAYDIKRGHISESERLKLYNAADLLTQECRILFRDYSSPSAWGDISRAIEAAKREYPALRMVAIDNTGLISAGTQTEYEAYGRISRGCRMLTNRLNVHIVLIHHLAKPQGNRDTSPSVRQLKGNGSLSQDATSVLLMDNTKCDENEQSPMVQIHLAKNNFGPTWSGEVCFHKSTQSFGGAGITKPTSSETYRQPVSDRENLFPLD